MIRSLHFLFREPPQLSKPNRFSACHTFSFADYHDPMHVHFRALRVINEDFVAPGRGFGMHPHRDMEIITYVLDGELAHKDSMGNGSVIHRDEVQRMTAGSGVMHSEFNPSAREPVHLLQIWIFPEKKALTPGYEQRIYPESEKSGKLRLIASRTARDGSVLIHQDSDIYASVLSEGQQVTYQFGAGRDGWIQIARGAVEVNGKLLKAGDGAAISGRVRSMFEDRAAPLSSCFLIWRHNTSYRPELLF